MPKQNKHLRSLKLGPQIRSVIIEQAKVDEETRTLEISFSSEEPYERYWGIEILGHHPDEVCLDRIKTSGALLMDHNREDQVGVVEDAWIDGATRKARARVRFGKSARASEVLQDVIDGIRAHISVGYRIVKAILLKSEKIEGSDQTIETYRITDWEPMEISLVSIPADLSVGVGRSEFNELNDISIIDENTNREEKTTMKKCEICGAQYEGDACSVCAKAKQEARQAESRAEKARVTEIMAIAKKHSLVDDGVRFIQEEKTATEFKDFVLGKLTAGPNDIDTEGRAATAPDQPVYRGSKASQLGQQLLDIRTMARPANHSASIVSAARSRLEQNQNRNRELYNITGRAAGAGGQTVGTPSEGGFFLQGETSYDLMTNGFNNSVVLSRCRERTLNAGTQYVEIVGIDETSRATGSRGGGVRVYTTAELAQLTPSGAKFNKIRIEPKKLTGLYHASGEIMNNVIFLGQDMKEFFSEEFAFKCQDQVIRGAGGGDAMGVLNAGCLVTVPKETGQVAKTISTKNISKMWARFSGKSPIWLINRDCGPELDELSIVVGDAALEPRFVTYDVTGALRIKGAPVFEIEQASTVGTVGDIMLCDFSQYITANKGDIDEAMSVEVLFLYDQQTFRFIYYFDGQPRWISAITPYQGSSTVSPFVALGTRG